MCVDENRTASNLQPACCCPFGSLPTLCNCGSHNIKAISNTAVGCLVNADAQGQIYHYILHHLRARGEPVKMMLLVTMDAVVQCTVLVYGTAASAGLVTNHPPAVLLPCPWPTERCHCRCCSTWPLRCCTYGSQTTAYQTWRNFPQLSGSPCKLERPLVGAVSLLLVQFPLVAVLYDCL